MRFTKHCVDSVLEPLPCFALNLGLTVQGMGVRHALNPDPYRGAFGNDGPRYAEDVNDLIQSATCGQVGHCMAFTLVTSLI